MMWCLVSVVAATYCLPGPSTQFSEYTTGAPSQADDDCPEPQEVLVSKEACLQFSSYCLSGAAIAPFSGCLSPEGDGLQPASSVQSFVLCTGWWCLRAFCMVAIPQSGLSAPVSSLRLPSGHSGQILTLNNAARESLSSPVAGAGVCAPSPLGELPWGS